MVNFKVDGCSPLMLLFKYNLSEYCYPIAKHLISIGANVNECLVKNIPYYPLTFLLKHNHGPYLFKLVQLLIDNQCVKHWSFIPCVLFYNHSYYVVNVINKLIKYKYYVPNPSVSLLYLCITTCESNKCANNFLTLLQSFNIMANESINFQNNDGKSLLMMSIELNKYNFAKLLIR